MRYYSSIAQLAALTTAVDSSATTMIASTVAGWPLTCPFTVVVDDSTLSEEIVTVTAVAGTTLTVVRAQDGSAGVSHSVGATVRHMVTARDLREPQEHMDRSAEVHGLDYMSDVVGTNTIQALQNKTIHGTLNTLDNIDQASVINLLTDLGNLYGYTKLAGNTLRATSYNAGDVIVRPDGTLWKAKVYFICTGTFNVADWDPVSVPIFPAATQAARDALPAGTATKSVPSGRSTRCASAATASWSSRCSHASVDITRSNDPSAKGSRCASPRTSVSPRACAAWSAAGE